MFSSNLPACVEKRVLQYEVSTSVAVREKGLQPGFRHPSTRFSLVNRSPEYCDFISASHRRVPETTFNNMHGTLANVATTDGTAWRSKPNMGALEKVGNLKYSLHWVLRPDPVTGIGVA